MQILIDATKTNPDIRVFGLSLVEHLLRSLSRCPLTPSGVSVAVHSENEVVEADHPVRRASAGGRHGDLHVTWEGGTRSLGERVSEAMNSDRDSDWLILSGETIVDARLIPQMAELSGNVFFKSGEGEECGAVLRLEAGARSSAPLSGLNGHTVLELTESLAADGVARALAPEEFDGYITKLRKDLEPYLFKIADDSARKRVERFMFWSNYKGSTDFMTKYVWPPLVWIMVRPLARWGVHPNWVTIVSILATFLAIPLWMEGWWAAGFGLAYLMSLLDSVDGKLARVTYTYSYIGNILDHGLDLVHPPFWYLAWAYGMSNGDTQSTLFQASVWMFGLYVVDRIFPPIFKSRTGRSIHGYLPIDVKIRTFLSRRNVNLPFFTAAVAIDLIRPGDGWEVSVAVFYAIVIWQAVCAVYHARRTLQFYNVEKGSAPA